MGAFYILANHTKRERVSPSRIPNGALKYGEILGNERVHRFVTWLLMTWWKGDHVVFLSDEGDDRTAHDVAEESYVDVTARLVEEHAEERGRT